MLRYFKALLLVAVPLTSFGAGIIAVSAHAGGAFFWVGFSLVPGLWLASFADPNAGNLFWVVVVVVQLGYWVGLIAGFFKWQSWRATGS